MSTETTTLYRRLKPGETLRIGADIIVTEHRGGLKITAPKSVKIEHVPAKPIDMGDSAGNN